MAVPEKKPFEFRRLQRHFRLDFDDIVHPERLTLTIWRNGKGKSALLEDPSQIKTLLKFIINKGVELK